MTQGPAEMAERAPHSPAAVASGRPLVTFVLFAYNQEKYIREAVESTLAQTYTPLEIILSDDCSQDSTFAIMQELAAAYRGPHQVRAVQTPHNLGLIQHVLLRGREARGEIVVVAAGDDVSAPGRVSALVPAFGPGIGAAYSLCDQIDEHGGLLNKAIERGERPRSFDRQIVRAMCLKGDSSHVRVTQGSTAAYRRELFEVPAGADRKRYSEEMLLGFYCHLRGMRVAFVEESLLGYRQRPGAMTNITEAEREALARRPEKEARQGRRANLDMYADFHRIAAECDTEGRIDLPLLVRNYREEEIKFFWIDMTFMQKVGSLAAAMLEGNFVLAGWCLSRLIGVYSLLRRP